MSETPEGTHSTGNLFTPTCTCTYSTLIHNVCQCTLIDFSYPPFPSTPLLHIYMYVILFTYLQARSSQVELVGICEQHLHPKTLIHEGIRYSLTDLLCSTYMEHNFDL